MRRYFLIYIVRYYSTYWNGKNIASISIDDNPYIYKYIYKKFINIYIYIRYNISLNASTYNYILGGHGDHVILHDSAALHATDDILFRWSWRPCYTT